MLEITGGADAFTRERGGLELDHRVPRIRASSDEERVDVEDEDTVKDTFMPLTREHNLAKSRACERCFETGERPIGPFGIPFFFDGNSIYDPATGCRGAPGHTLKSGEQ